MLNRHIAPITDRAWEEIDSRAKEVLSTYLSSRKVLKVRGPKGLGYTVVEEGRIGNIEKDDDVRYGKYQVKPLVESRIEFELSRWELDNIERGSRDVELDALEDAVKKLALFEENAIYKGLKNGDIKGLLNDASTEALKLGDNAASILQAISDGIIKLKEAYAEKSYTLVVGEKVWKLLNMEDRGYPLIKRVEYLLETEVVYSHVLEDEALLIPYDHDDLEMTIGQDFAIGCQSFDNEKVKLFITESFTYRSLDPDIIIKYKM